MRVIEAAKVFRAPGACLMNAVRMECNYHCSEHRHSGFHEFVYVKTGELRHTINGHEYLQQPGWLTLIRESDVHHLQAREVSYVNLAFPSAFLSSPVSTATPDIDVLSEAVNAAEPPRTQLVGSRREAFELDLNRVLLYQGTRYERLVFQEFLFSTLLDYVLSLPPPSRPPSGIPEWLQACLMYMLKNPEVDFCIEDILALCGRTHEHVTRRFRKHLGMTPSQFLNGRRLQRAESLLRYTNSTISEISRTIGFSNTNYFHKLFRDRTGMSPVEFRTAHDRRVLS